MAAACGNGGAATWLPRRQFEYVACVAVPDLESVFGIFGADSDLGTSSKVALLWMLYKLD